MADFFGLLGLERSVSRAGPARRYILLLPFVIYMCFKFGLEVKVNLFGWTSPRTRLCCSTSPHSLNINVN